MTRTNDKASITPQDAARRLTSELARRGVNAAEVLTLAVAGEGGAGGVSTWIYTLTLKGGRILKIKIA